ncbi:MAG TPA: EAL domain-containing protein [Telluria sp.]|nr:EAL domain-containing protein [Telluria sp.]
MPELLGGRPIAVLLVEDNRGDARLIELMVAQAPRGLLELTTVDNLTDGIAHLRRQPPDVLLLDLGLPESTGLDTLRKVLAAVPTPPAVVALSSLSDEDIAVQAVQLGAQDYLVKGQLDAPELVRALRYAMERSQARLALQRAHDELDRRVMERTLELANTIKALHAEIAERKQADERIRYMAHYDALTGLPNRALLQDRINQAIALAHRTQTQVGVLFIDLDYFKNINDSLGHHIGDRLLQLAAGRLQTCVREDDSVARLGGDEFVLSLPLLNDSNDAAQVARKVLDAFAQPFTVEEHQLHIGASVGISVYPDDGTDMETLMRTADTAMYHAKEMGRGNFQFFTAALNNAVQQRLVVGTRLRSALAHDEFVLHYQPQVDMESGLTFSAEALLRWQPRGQPPIPCGAFVAHAEESGLIVPIGEWALRCACKQLRAWHDAGHPELKMAVNLSPRQLEQSDFCALVGEVLDDAGIPAQSLELEITEGTLMRHSKFNLATLARLSDMGVRLSVDDFGTGYSSLAYLQRFPVHALKIDQSFVHDIGADPNANALITAIVAMAASLRLTVVAEGVETWQQLEFLHARGCPAAQGFYFSEAVPAQVFITMLDQWNETNADGAGWRNAPQPLRKPV